MFIDLLLGMTLPMVGVHTYPVSLALYTVQAVGDGGLTLTDLELLQTL